MQEDSPKVPESDIEARINIVVRALKEKGPTNPEAAALLVDLIKSTEKVADHITNGHGRIGLDRFRANIYLKAGYKEEAIESLEAALMQASGEGDPELWDAINAELEKIRLEF